MIKGKKICFANKQTALLLLLSLLFCVAPFYIQPNLNGGGFSLTFNISVWLVASWIVAFGLLLVLKQHIFIWPKYGSYFLVFPIILILTSIVSMTEIKQPIAWLFRQAYIFGGILFLFTIFQFQIKHVTVDKVLLAIAVAIGIHAFFGMMQITSPDFLPAWFPKNIDNIPSGVFQQINVQASFLTTGMMIVLYLISRPSFRSLSVVFKVILILSFSMAFYVVIASGSRIGLLSIFISFPLLLWGRRKQLYPQKNILIILLILSCSSFWSAQDGFNKTIDKTQRMVDSKYSDTRVDMYRIGMSLIQQKPVTGYGIGGFLKAWNQQASADKLHHPEVALLGYITHPHNELLFWMVEGGILAVIGIFFFILGITLSLFWCGISRGSAYTAMLLPIGLHTQVELPFYLSSVHWFLWLFLIFIVLRHRTRIIKFSVSRSITLFAGLIVVVFSVLASLFLIKTVQAQADIYKFLYDKDSSPPHLRIALKNLYFKPLAEQIAMRSMLYASIENNDRSKVIIFKKWAENYIDTRPELKMYEDLVSASVFLRPEGEGCDAISAGYEMYIHNVPLKLAHEKCIKANEQ
ncbi:MAG: hypothetical protein COA95_07110 [Methylophaga sp.]|nr:MAG: hypothetical protein COA95_07110 [Methylophaga sp.]